MRLLLDTHVFLWWYSDAPELPVSFRAALSDQANAVLVSAAVAWEIVIKRALGKLEFDGLVATVIDAEGFQPLPISCRHVDEVARLEAIHRDPFDRLLLAQARVEGVVLATTDPVIRRYPGVAFLDA